MAADEVAGAVTGAAQGAGRADHDVVVVGGGPTGTMLGAELTLAGVDVLVVERRDSRELDSSRAGGLHARSLEVLDQRGAVDRFLAAGQTMQTNGFALIPLDISDARTRFPHGLALWQRDIERTLGSWADELGVRTRWGTEVVGITPHTDAVHVGLDDGTSLTARYVVGCDGGRSVVRRSAGIGFEGLDASTSWLIAEVELADEPELGMRQDDVGSHGITPLGPGGPYRVLFTERQMPSGGDGATADDVTAALDAVYGTDFGFRRAIWASRFSDATRLATQYRSGRLLLAGDAAHLHPPHGGQGLNTGIQDAVNLGWKLARVARGTSPDDLLDTYQAERRPVADRAIELTMAQVALGRPDERHGAARRITAELLAMDEPRRHLAGQLSGLAIRYDLGGHHPLVGWRMPDLDLVTADGPTRVAELLRTARPVLLLLDGAPADQPAIEERVEVVRATTDGGSWPLPMSGDVPAAPAVLVRPDGHVAWAGSPADPTLVTALDRWFGPVPR